MIVSSTQLNEAAARLEKLVNAGIKIKNVEIGQELDCIKFNHGKSRYRVSTVCDSVERIGYGDNDPQAKRLKNKLALS